jgi:hypothetical protein
LSFNLNQCEEAQFKMKTVRNPARKGVEAKEQFTNEMQDHRRRVLALGLAVLFQYQSEFTCLDPHLLTDYLRLHDSPKVEPIASLRAQGYLSDTSLAERFSVFYGRSLASLSGEHKFALQETINDLNRLESTAKLEFFKARRLSNEVIDSLQRVEEIADATDTGFARQAEMGLPLKPYNGEAFLLSRGDKPAAAISRWLEDHYLSFLPQQS